MTRLHVLVFLFLTACTDSPPPSRHVHLDSDIVFQEDASIPDEDATLIDAALIDEGSIDAALIDMAVCIPVPCLVQGGVNCDFCDGVDDDCDGVIDEDFSPGPCEAGLGVCRDSLGTVVCQEGSVVCSAQARTEQTTDEVCDLRDNDCDGQVDEHIREVVEEYDDLWQIVEVERQGGMLCRIGPPSCPAFGRYECRDADGALFCNAVPIIPSADQDICNGFDDDCDGLFDEDFVIEDRACGVGVCTNTLSPWRECVNGEVVRHECIPFVDRAVDEVCDTLDNDCDGQVDEVILTPCIMENGCVGERGCQNGESVCRGFRMPRSEHTGRTDIDDDCDGVIDEGHPRNGCSPEIDLVDGEACVPAGWTINQSGDPTWVSEFIMMSDELSVSRWAEIIEDAQMSYPGSNFEVMPIFAPGTSPIRGFSFVEAALFANMASAAANLPDCYRFEGCMRQGHIFGAVAWRCPHVTLVPNCRGYRLPFVTEWRRVGYAVAGERPFAELPPQPVLYTNRVEQEHVTNPPCEPPYRAVNESGHTAWGFAGLYGNVSEWAVDRDVGALENGRADWTWNPTSIYLMGGSINGDCTADGVHHPTIDDRVPHAGIRLVRIP